MHHPQRHFTLGEYFDIEAHSGIKHEYLNGEIFAMAGASLAHNHISLNAATYLRSALRGSGCNAFGSDLRISTPGGLYTYPDISVICGRVELIKDGRDESATNPVILIEVLSPATRDYDRGNKFTMYQAIPTLREYVLVEQDRVLVECFRKQADAAWTPQTYSDLDARIELASTNVSVPCREMYREVFP